MAMAGAGAVKALGYLGFGVSDVAAWRDYMGYILGCHVDDQPDGSLKIRVDSRAWRFSIEPDAIDDILYAGWECDGPESLRALTEKLRGAGYAVTDDPGLAIKRGVLGLARTVDPNGVPCELFWGASEAFPKPLVPGMGGSPFVTGEQGLGHIVLSSTRPAETQAFYGDLLGFKISDVIDYRRLGPDHITPVTFMYCNPRHHSMAYAVMECPKKLLHFMLQREQLDDVGYALDRIGERRVKLSMTLGRHVNDHMVSFYAFTPSGTEVEYGWGARTVEPEIWSIVRHDHISTWGHKTVHRPGTGWIEDAP